MKTKRVSENEAIEIGMRLNQAHTKSSAGDTGKPAVATDKISRRNVSELEAEEIADRLYKTPILMATIDPNKDGPKIQDKITRNPKMSKAELDEVTDRLFTSYPKCQQEQKPVKIVTNDISRPPATEEEIEEIYGRLKTTHTKSSSGGAACRPVDSRDLPGYGSKCFPVIQGIETKFKADKGVSQEQYNEITDRLLKTQTCNTQARLDNPKVLLYPERTKLMNNPGRIRVYQDSGSVVKQKEMERREKWFN